MLGKTKESSGGFGGKFRTLSAGTKLPAKRQLEIDSGTSRDVLFSIIRKYKVRKCLCLKIKLEADEIAKKETIRQCHGGKE